MRKVHKLAKNRRKIRVRSNIRGTESKPRISVFRSNRYIYVQAINDLEGKTLASASSHEVKAKGSKSEQAKEVGMEFGKKLKDLKIKTGVYDRGSYRYHGRVKSLADGVRESGITI